MSQYPPNPNYNPYGQNPSDPNYNQGTAYGGPPSGPGQNPNPYNPYPNNPPAPDTNPSSYGPYGQNPPTPVPPPYNPYAQTAPNTAPNYNQYGTIPPAPTMPPTQPRRGPSTRVILIAVIALVLVLGGIAFGFVSYNNAQQGYATATATAQANSRATATAQANQTATAQAALTATAVASTFPFSANVKMTDPMTDNSKGNGWESNANCKFQGSAYHVLDTQTNTFNSCSAINTDFKDFTFQVEAVLNSGDGLGITFRGNGSKGQFYRIDIGTDGSYGIYVYVDNTGSNARTLTSGNLPSTPTLGNTNNIAIVARGSTMMLYFNQTEVTSFTDPTYSHGQIGVETIDITHSADAVFTNVQVWALS
jgi:hypothetical protein